MKFQIRSVYFFWFFCFVFLKMVWANPHFREQDDSVLYLSQDLVIKVVLEDSLRYRQLQAEEQASSHILAVALSLLDWQLFFETRFDSKEQNTLSFFENPWETKHNTFFGLAKPFLTGTKVKLQYMFLQSKKDFNLDFKKVGSFPPVTFRPKIGLEVEQDLWRNIFGYEDRIKLNMATTKTEVQKIKFLEKKEGLILQALQQFWGAYVSQRVLKSKQSQKKDYENLLRITKSKTAYNYTKPGELAQIQAEWEKAKQELILQKMDYEDKISKLLDFLSLEQKKQVVLVADGKLLPPSVLIHKRPDQTFRTVLLLKKQLFIQQQELEISRSGTWPTLKLFGSYSIGGYENDLASSFESLKLGKVQNHSIGIKFNYPFSAHSLRKKRLELSEQMVEARRHEWEITKREFAMLWNQSQKNITAFYQAFKSAKKIHHLRSRSYKEIRKAFLQGRLSVFDLIRAKELALLAEMEKSRLKARYYQVLAYIRALQDQLIPS